MRVIFTILLTLLIYNTTWASIISLSTKGTTAFSKGQSKQITTDYLKVNLYRKLINLSVTYLKKSADLAGKNYSDDEIRDLATAVAKISFSDINISTLDTSSSLSMALTLYIDTDTINRFIVKSVENNQFKAFAKNLYDDLIVIETDLLTSKKDTEQNLIKKVEELFYIQRNRAYEMNQLALSAYLDAGSIEENDLHKRKLMMKESNINAILDDINNYDEALITAINQSMQNAIDLSKAAVIQIKTDGNLIAAEPFMFNDVQEFDLISAKNESISLRKQIATLIKASNFYISDVSEKLTRLLNNLENQLEFVRLYDTVPMRAKWEASYQYQFRLNNYNKRLERIHPLFNANANRINFIKTKVLLEIDITNYLSLIKILAPFEIYIKELQAGQYLGPEIDQAYIMDVGKLKVSKSQILLPFTVRYHGEEYIFNFNLSDFDQDKIIYLIENPNRFSVAPIFSLSSSGPTPYDVTQVHSGFSIYHRVDNFSEIFTTNTAFIPFPETNLLDRLKHQIQLKATELDHLIDTEKDANLENILSSFDTDYNELKLSDLTMVQATDEQIISLPPIEEINDNIPEEIIQEDVSQEEITQNKIDLFDNISNPPIPAEYYEYFDNLSDYDYLFEPKTVDRYRGAIFAHLASKLQSSDFKSLGYTLGTIGITGQYQFKIPLALEAQINYTSFFNGTEDFFLIATKQIDYLLFVLFQYPVSINNFNFIPFIGIGAGASSIFLDYENEKSIDQPLATKNLTNTTSFLLSSKAGIKILVKNFIISTGAQINKLRPTLLGKSRNMDSYQIFIEIGYSFRK